MENAKSETGALVVAVTDETGAFPLKGVTVELFYTGNPSDVLERLTTDESGRTRQISLAAPPRAYSQEPNNLQPYAEYTARLTLSGYGEQVVSGIEIFPDETALQTVRLFPATQGQPVYDPLVIDGNSLYESYPPKIAEPEVKPLAESGEIVLSRVVVPETIVVHDGPPSDKTAANYYVPYLDYIKNVACSEIYSTWPESTIEANLLAIMSFTLNRVYTEWYRNKGYSFTITSSTAYDHKWTRGRTIFDSIAGIADRLYDKYVARPNVKQPILTQYCDGKRVSCPNWMSQWGSKALGDDGLSAEEILRYYYGDVYINQAEIISGIPASYPGYDLTVGSSGEKVLMLQEQLNRIAKNYPAIPTIAADGIFGSRTKEAVAKFQEVFRLPANGIVDYPTWYKISQIYVGVSKIGENVN